MKKTTPDPRPEYYFALLKDLKYSKALDCPFDRLDDGTFTSKDSGRCYNWIQLFDALRWMMEERDAGGTHQGRAVTEHQAAYQNLIAMGWRPPRESVSMQPNPINYNLSPGLVTYDTGTHSFTALVNIRLSPDGPLLEKVIMPLSGDENFKVHTDPKRDEEGSALLDLKAPPRRHIEPDTRGIWGDTPPPPHDPVNSPSHYTDGGIEVIDYLKAKMTREEFIGFLRGNALKYLSRAGKKINAVEDYKKADWYSERLVKTLTEKKEQ